MEPFEKKGMEERGFRHVIAGFWYSMAGAKVLLQESAARLECAMAVAAFLLFVWAGAGIAEYAILFALFLLVLCVEALNTAVELIVDRTSPEQSEYGKMTKDVDSFAVFCTLTIFCVFTAWVVLGL